MYFKLELINQCDKDRIEATYENKMIEPGTQDLFWSLELYSECESYSLNRLMYVKAILEAHNISSRMLSIK